MTLLGDIPGQLPSLESVSSSRIAYGSLSSQTLGCTPVTPFIDAFRLAAKDVLAECPELWHEWIDAPDRPKSTLLIPVPHEGGFEIRMECESYGLYPSAGPWQGAPWDVQAWSPDELHASVSEFLRSVLSTDSELVVMLASGVPYKWRFKYRYEGELAEEEGRRFFFNWFGTRTESSLRNSVLPPL